MVERFCICRRGKVRTVNQDRAGCYATGDWCLGFVADGLGGHFGGERASETFAQACEEWWTSFAGAPQRPGFLQCQEQLGGLLRRCHGEIAKIAPPWAVCGTTVVLLWITKGEYALFSMGDSRCYAVPRRLGIARKPVQLTQDDVLPAGKLTRALGPGVCSFSLKTGKAARGTVFALCSDGIYKACPGFHQELRKLGPKQSLGEAAERIAAQVDANGAPDNYSLVLLRMGT